MIPSIGTRCPYSLLPLEHIASISREHVILDAIGGPNSYWVSADEAINNKLGSTVDVAFANEPLVAMLSMLASVQTRSGPARWRVRGETAEGARPVVSTFTPTSVDVYHRKPVDRLGTEGKLEYQIIAPKPQAAAELQKLRENLRKKGISVEEPKHVESLNQIIQGRLELNLIVLQAGLMKIAYLSVFRLLGDEFLEDPLNAHWQAAIRMSTSEERDSVSIKAAFSPEASGDLIGMALPPLEDRHHGISILQTHEGLRVIVRLFGKKFLTVAANVSEARRHWFEPYEGILIRVDARDATLLESSWSDHRYGRAPWSERSGKP